MFTGSLLYCLESYQRPYCAKICPYCDFNKYINRGVDHLRMKSALLAELKDFIRIACELKRTSEILFNSVYFGGGTPSLAHPSTLGSVISYLSDSHLLVENPEITLEANPTDTETAKLKDFRAIGVNRLSLGIQALNDSDLKFMGRNHSAQEARKSIQQCMQIFPNVSFDLIYARHRDHTIVSWQDELKEALQFGAPHMSLYELTIEPNTGFFKKMHNKQLVKPDSDQCADMFSAAQELTLKYGLVQYEVSNFARPGYQSTHNLSYWNYNDYIGIGPGACGRITGGSPEKITYSFQQTKHPVRWMEGVELRGARNTDPTIVSADQRLLEVLLCGLRKVNGIERSTFVQLIGKNFEEVLDPHILQQLAQEGLVVLDNKGLRTTPRGLGVLDSILHVFSQSVGNR